MRSYYVFIIFIVFFSCKKSEFSSFNKTTDNTELKQSLAIEPNWDPHVIEYCESMVEISGQMIEILNSEDNMYSGFFDSSYLNLDSLSTFESVFLDAGFSQNIEMSNLMKNVLNSAENLIEESSYLNELSENELEELFRVVISDLIDDEEILIGATPGSICKTKYDNAVGRCRAMSAVGLAGAGVSAVFSFGIGTLIGAVTMLYSLHVCLNSAQMDYKFCLKNFK